MCAEALEREGDERARFLEEACRGDDELRTLVDWRTSWNVPGKARRPAFTPEKTLLVPAASLGDARAHGGAQVEGAVQVGSHHTPPAVDAAAAAARGKERAFADRRRPSPAQAETGGRTPHEKRSKPKINAGLAGALQGRAAVRPGTREYGEALETWLLHELVSWRDYVSGEPLSFWRSTSGFEVDFLIGDHTAVELKASADVSPGTSARGAPSPRSASSSACCACRWSRVRGASAR